MKNIFTPPLPFISRKKKNHHVIELVPKSGFDTWITKQSNAIKNKCASLGFKGTSGQIIVQRNEDGLPCAIIAGITSADSLYDFAKLASALSDKFQTDLLKTASFEFSKLSKSSIEKCCLGWALSAYKFNTYKTEENSQAPMLLWPKDAEKSKIEAAASATYALRDLVNLPSNDLGPDEIEQCFTSLGKTFEAKISVIKDQALIDKNFPLIYTVGKASPRRPRLLELNWGDPKHPKLSLVGKGVCFDTGGLDLKPSQYMRYMKKDMGGAAHVIALAYMVMSNKLPVRLQVLIPAVENSVAGDAFRPGDIIKSRKGTYVENTNTDAEGRLILADTLTYACESSPDLIIDYATLTGSARAALGPDIPAFFTNADDVAKAINKCADKNPDDPLWNMPLWQPYRKHIESSQGDIVNSAGLPGDLIYSALFLEGFLNADKKGKTPSWVHIDCNAWELTGVAGRPRGGADTGLHTMFAFLQNKYKP